MLGFEKDLHYTLGVLLENKYPNYSNIYLKSNEDLETLFKNIDVFGKDILSVTGSGDQALMSLYNGASSVTMFDINKLAKHYFYLRKWSIEYLNLFYPDESIYINNDWIKYLLSLVQVNNDDELESFKYWNGYLNFNGVEFNKRLFMRSSSTKNNIDIDELKLVIPENIEFYNKDISKESICDKKFDVIIMSNILEYYPLKKEELAFIRDNLYSLLNNSGIVLCSYLMDKSASFVHYKEVQIMSSKFDIEEFSSKDKGYAYIKK